MIHDIESYFVKITCMSVFVEKIHWKTLGCPLALMNRKNNRSRTLALAGSRKYVSFFILIQVNITQPSKFSVACRSIFKYS